jgi:penicillin-binding protein 1C
MIRTLAIAGLLAAASLARASEPVPAFDDVRGEWRASYGWLLDRDGVVLEADRLDFDDLRGQWVALDEVSPALRAAVVAIEDRRFYEHGGVDGRALAAAAWQVLRGDGRRGASTITMQLAGLLADEDAKADGRRHLAGKWQQMRAAWRLERSWSKAQIL